MIIDFHTHGVPASQPRIADIAMTDLFGRWVAKTAYNYAHNAAFTDHTIGICLSVAVLYHGVPRMMEPDPPHAFGLFLMSSLLLALVTGLVRFATAAYLSGKFSKLQAIVSDLAARLPF